MDKLRKIYSLLYSVNLAIFTISCIALTSIVGTVIPQKENAEFYSSRTGEITYKFITLFDLDNMYSSWWFVGLLGLLGVNLICCTIKRFPIDWRQIHTNNYSITGDRIARLKNSYSFPSAQNVDNTVTEINNYLAQLGWKSNTIEREGGKLIFCQKEAVSRFGVYFVHTSILVVFLGASIGHFFGYKGSIMLPETVESNKVFPYQSKDMIDLGFTIRCDKFDIEFYSNGMPKEYRSWLTVLENGEEVLKKDIEVNNPLTYKGVTFYQASYRDLKDFSIWISSAKMGERYTPANFQEEIVWQPEGLRFGVINAEIKGEIISRLKIWFSDSTDPPSVFWVNNDEQVNISRTDTSYVLKVKQRYATGLQVAKDPGVGLVYLGCAFMIIGLYMAFFMSHKRIWILVKDAGTATYVYAGGTTNKNKITFNKKFENLVHAISQKN